MATGRRMAVENVLIGLIVVLAVWGIGVQIMIRRVVQEDRSLGDGDEERLANEIATIEQELVEQYTAQQIDVWAPEGGDDNATDAEEDDVIDPNQPNANGEFEVAALRNKGGKEVLLASRLLFPVSDDDWCELRLARPIPANSYKLTMSGVLGRWGAHASGGLPLLQVRVHGQWEPLMGSPRERVDDLEAPLEHNFSVPHSFDGVRLRANTWKTFNSGGRLSLAQLGARILPPEPPRMKRSRFLTFELEKGIAAAQLSLFNGIALAMLLNVTAVIPHFYTFYDDLGRQRSADDPAAFVPMDFFFDVDVFISTLAPVVRVVRQLPSALVEFAREETVQQVSFINPLLWSSDLPRLVEHFHMHNILMVGSLAKKLTWNTAQLARLRILLHAALRPSDRVARYADHVRKGIEAFAKRKKLSSAYVSLQLPVGEDWTEYCRQQQLSQQVADYRTCDLPAEDVTMVLEERQVGEVSRLLYVATGVLSIADLQLLHRQRFVVITKSRFTLDIQPDIANVVDMQVCRESSLFVGNLFSSFSYLQREAKLVAGQTERASYYNLDPDATLGDITKEEALRWDVLPLGIGQEELGTAGQPTNPAAKSEL